MGNCFPPTKTPSVAARHRLLIKTLPELRGGGASLKTPTGAVYLVDILCGEGGEADSSQKKVSG